MAKLTLHTMAAAKAVFMNQGGAQALMVLKKSGTSHRNALQWLDDWSMMCIREAIAEVRFDLHSSFWHKVL